MKKLKVDLLAEPSIGMNQSGMLTQIDTIHDFFTNDNLIDIQKYDIWNYRNPDIAHVFGMSPSLFQHLQILKQKGIKIICSPNHWCQNTTKEKILMHLNYKNIIYSNRVTQKFVFNNSHKIIVNSNGEKKMFVQNFGITEDKIRVIYNSYGQNISNCGNIFCKKYNISPPFCLMIGMLGAERKNQLRILKIWREDFPHLYILGGIFESSYAKKCISAINLHNNITYLGYEKEFSIIESAYQNCSLLISPGLVETPSLVALRALLNGANVCSTNAFNIPNEYFGMNAHYFNPTNEKEILNTIICALNNPKQINENDLIQFSDNYIKNQYRNLYKDIS